MFKSKLIIRLLCLCVVAGIANAQEKKPQVIQSEPQLEDIYNAVSYTHLVAVTTIPATLTTTTTVCIAVMVVMACRCV